MGAAIAMGVIAGVSALTGAIGAGEQAAAGAAASQQQQAFQNFQTAMSLQRKNREIARKNALMWQNNKNIERAANRARAEEEFWLRYNFNNETGSFSRQTKQTNDALVSQFQGKGMMGSQTAKQIMRMNLERSKQGLSDRRVQFGNQMLTAKRREQSALGKRNFGYQAQVPFMEGMTMTPSPDAIMSSALTSGLVQGTLTGIGSGMNYAAMDAAATPASQSQGAVNT